jgi:hypothetical protein
MNSVWPQLIAGMMGLASTVTVKLLEHHLKRAIKRHQHPRRRPVRQPGRPPVKRKKVG